MILKTELHVHSCLSPCASLEMSPRRIVSEARRAGIGILALTDHNSALNCEPFGKLCKEAGILPVYGLEAATREEVHALCLFGSPAEALALGDELYNLLPDTRNDPERFGDQVRVDEEENILAIVDKILTAAADIALDELKRLVLSRGGLFIPAHVDRPVFSILSQLGFIPDDDYSAIEIIRPPCPRHPGAYSCTSGSDAHYPEDIGKRAFDLEARKAGFLRP